MSGKAGDRLKLFILVKERVVSFRSSHLLDWLLMAYMNGIRTLAQEMDFDTRSGKPCVMAFKKGFKTISARC